MACDGPRVVRMTVRIPVMMRGGELPKNQNQPQLGEFSTKSPANFYQALCTQNSERAFQHPYG